MAGRQYVRTVTDTEFLLSDPVTGEVAMSFPLPLMTLRSSGKYIASYAIRGIHLSNATTQWKNQAERYRQEYAQREEQTPAVFTG